MESDSITIAKRPADIDQHQFENFEKAWGTRSAGCYEYCACGRVFYDVENSYDWNEGEMDQLRANPNAFARSYGIERVNIDGVIYASDCDCWHEKATRIINWLDVNRYNLKEYFELERKRLLALAGDTASLD